MVAKGSLTAEEEQRLIDEAWAHRDDEKYWDFEHPRRVNPQSTFTYPLRLEYAKLQAIQRLASARGIPMSRLIEDALARLIAEATAVAEVKPATRPSRATRATAR
ncbi:MAG: hypothetical protein WEB00_16015 [Dehalococcoidia bacterium]